MDAIQWSGTLDSLHPILCCGRWNSLAMRVEPEGRILVPLDKTSPRGTGVLAVRGNYILFDLETKQWEVMGSTTFENQFSTVTDV